MRIALKFTTQILQKHSRSRAGSSWYGPAGLQEYDDKKGNIYEESTFWRNPTEIEGEGGFIMEERERKVSSKHKRSRKEIQERYKWG